MRQEDDAEHSSTGDVCMQIPPGLLHSSGTRMQDKVLLVQERPLSAGGLKTCSVGKVSLPAPHILKSLEIKIVHPSAMFNKSLIRTSSRRMSRVQVAEG